MGIATIAVLAAHRHPRLRYVLKEIGRDLGWQLHLFTDQEAWTDFKADGKVVYGDKYTETPSVHWPAHSFLSGGEPEPALWDSVELTEQTDLLAAIFYALSRYEEYQDFVPDARGRFPAEQSKAREFGYLQRPVVREWTARLGAGLRKVFPGLLAKRVAFSFVPTYDIDLLWAWQYRGWRGSGAGVRDFLTGHHGRAWKRFFGPAERDPYARLDWIKSLHPRTRPHIFWLLADNRDPKDPNPYPIPAAQKAAIQEADEWATTGIHPSYHSSNQEDLFRTESDRLTDIIGRRTLHSRQHFLRFRLPATYRALQLTGISNDHSMGYADATGWRAGTNQSFFWYDLEKEQATGLLVHPFAAMDVTLKNYLELNAESARKHLLELAENLRPYGGPFVLLWHNSSFAADYGWAGWREMYQSLVNDLLEIE